MTRSVLLLLAGALGAAGCAGTESRAEAPPVSTTTRADSIALVARDLTDGQQTFRFDTFGDEAYWTDSLHLNAVIEQSVDPTTALSVGLKVDADVLPEGLLARVDLRSPATTVALLKLNAVIGVVATVDSSDHITRLGITCALCHSTVDNSVAPGIGRRMDGWPNHELNAGAIIALSPAIRQSKRAVYRSWGPGMYDPRYNQDGKSAPLVLPPAYGLAAVKNVTYAGDGSIAWWNAYVAVTQMHGQGNFADARFAIEVRQEPDLVTWKLPALGRYQHSLMAPPPPAGSVEKVSAERGHSIFEANCATCHVGTTGTDNNAGTLHAPSETGMNTDLAARTASKGYRTTPLRGLWQHAPYFHDGSASTLAAVVAHYNRVRKLQLTAAQQRDLVEYLKSK